MGSSQTPSSQVRGHLPCHDTINTHIRRWIQAQAARTSTFPPPPDYGRWTDDAVDELLTEMIAKKGGVAFLLEILASVDNQCSAERFLLATVQNFLKDQAKGTAHGKLRARYYSSTLS